MGSWLTTERIQGIGIGFAFAYLVGLSVTFLRIGRRRMRAPFEPQSTSQKTSATPMAVLSGCLSGIVQWTAGAALIVVLAFLVWILLTGWSPLN